MRDYPAIIGVSGFTGQSDGLPAAHPLSLFYFDSFEMRVKSTFPIRMGYNHIKSIAGSFVRGGDNSPAFTRKNRRSKGRFEVHPLVKTMAVSRGAKITLPVRIMTQSQRIIFGGDRRGVIELGERIRKK